MNEQVLQIEKKSHYDWASHDFLWVLILGLVTVAGEPAFNVLFVALCLYAFLHRNYSIPLVFFSGYLKIIPVVAEFPVDFTALTIAFFAFYTVLNILGRQKINTNILITSILLIMMFLIACLSILYTPATFRFLKVSALFVLLNIAIATTILLFWDLKEPRKILVSFSNFSIAIGILWIGQALHNQAFGIIVLDQRNLPMWHISSFGEDYMAFSAFVIFLIIRFGILFVRENKSLFSSALLVVFFYCLLASPARGLTAGLILSILVVGVYSFNAKINLKKVFAIAFSIVAAVAVIIIFKQDLEIALNRLTTVGADTTSIKYRINTFYFVFEKWSDQMLLGTGIDSTIFFKGTPGSYLHNVILEAVFELGLLGGLPFLLFFGLSLYSFHIVLKHSIRLHDHYLLWISMIFFVFFVFSLFSGSLSQIRPLWILMSLMLAISFNLKHIKKSAI